MKTFKVTLGRMFHKGDVRTITLKAKSGVDAIHRLAWRAHRGIIPKDSSLKQIKEVKE
jgi:hypothetical protein